MTVFAAMVSPVAGMIHCPAAAHRNASSAPAGAVVQKAKDSAAAAIQCAAAAIQCAADCGPALRPVRWLVFILTLLRLALKIAGQSALFGRWCNLQRREYLLG
jgi:hypothetical protein